MNVGWPEGIWIGIVVLNLLIAAINDGKPKAGNYSFPIAFMGSMLGAALLYWGGFFA